MDFRFSPEDEAFRRELLEFLKTELPVQREGLAESEYDADWEVTRAVRRKLAQRGWLTMHWPREYGGQGASPLRQAVFDEEMAYHRAPGRDLFGARMLGPALIKFGTEEQKRRFLPPIARGEVQWCQGYSEPGTGSDLASVSTRATEDGDHWVVNGSKIWTSAAHRADWMFLLTRTDPDAPRHRGLSFLLVDMKSPGVSVQPIRNMAGAHYFNQVFLDNVRVPKANLVGERGQGWYVALAVLDLERSAIEYSAVSRRLLDDVAAFAREHKRGGHPLLEDPRVRDRLAQRAVECQVGRLMAYRVAWMQGRGLMPNKEASMTKVFGSELLQRVAATAMEVLGLYGPLRPGDPWAKLGGRVQDLWLTSFAATIRAGTSEIQRNIIALRGLGLPRE